MNAVIHLPITHVLLFQFKTTADPTAVANLLKAVLAMKDNCVQTKANGKSKPYIKSVKGGRDNSPEGVQFGITHAFIMEFNSVSDRDYYVASDKEHHRLQKVVAPLIEKAQAIDFNAGVF
ncbi:dabb-domain-containing protein [Delitschia confertaspora ATCC 74209]|uniref:Dabb-domain-containing protein n=1 Tax=Delitschia confertaspora ATCC 74209 TaxID=1513339 RepID=A0A9P4MPP2_9PLEO|nr:dabb-domain-containing protein [Delitschia confertaspora ATCC 74209]